MKISVLDQSQLIEGGTPELAFEHTSRLARHADQLGYHRYWLSEHHNSESLAGSAPEILAGYLAAQTKRIHVGTGGVMLPHYSAYKVAESFKVLSGLAPGRIDLGLGRAPGGMPLATRALQDLKLRDTDTFPDQIRMLLHYLDGTLPPSHPLQGLKATPEVSVTPEVWLLGSSMFSSYLAAQLGLPYAFAHFINYQPGYMDEAIRRYVDTFTPSGKLEKPQVLVAAKIIAAESDDEAEELAASALRFNHMLMRGGRIGRLASPEKALDYITDPLNRDEINEIKKSYMIGSPATLARKIGDLRERLPIDELMAVSPIYDFNKRMQSYTLLKQAADALPSL